MGIYLRQGKLPGGYCLPKDTKQLPVKYADVPENLIEAIVEKMSEKNLLWSDELCWKRGKSLFLKRNLA